jgi:hypothetical protein
MIMFLATLWLSLASLPTLSWNLFADAQTVLSYPFMQNAFLAGSVVAVVAGIVGYFVVLRSLSFATHALSHIGFAGATGALVLSLSPVYGMLALTLGSSTLIGLLLTIRATSGDFDRVVRAHEPGHLDDGIEQRRHKAQMEFDDFMAVFTGQVLPGGIFSHMITDRAIGKGEAIDNPKPDQEIYHAKSRHPREVLVRGANFAPEIFNREVSVRLAFLRDIHCDDFSWVGAFQTRVRQSLQDSVRVRPFELR